MSQFFESIVGRLALLFDPQELGVAAGDIVSNLVIFCIEPLTVKQAAA
jgi:hypothetical protein